MLPIAAFEAASFTKKWQKRGVKATYVRKNPGDSRSAAACRQIFHNAASPSLPHSDGLHPDSPSFLRKKRGEAVKNPQLPRNHSLCRPKELGGVKN
jgi:hypothetical protein